METDLQIRLKDGRKLGYAEYGDPAGKPVFFFHGFPGSRYQVMPLNSVFERMHARVIAPERPGLGLSTFKAGRKITDWPEDILELADALKIKKFAVCGVSGGGPYALVCAWKIPQYIATTSIVAGIGPITEPGSTDGMKESNLKAFRTAREAPWKLHFTYFIARFIDPVKMLRKNLAKMIEPDRLVMQKPEMLEMTSLDAKASFRQGTRGLVLEIMLYANDWGFKLQEIQKEVQLWQGEKDVNVPPGMGHYQARMIPNCIAHFLPEEAHLSLPFNRAEEIFTEALNF